MGQKARSLAVVTGASSGIGYELARICAQNGMDLVIAADRPSIHKAADDFRRFGVHVEAVETDLSSESGVDRLYDALQGAPVDALLANAGHGLGEAFLDQDFDDARHVIDTNVTGTAYLLHRIGRDMRARGRGRILITGSVAGYMPGAFQAVYNATKAFVDSFALALRNELEGTGVTVTCLMPGPTDTQFFDRAKMQDTRVGQGKKDDPAMVARTGFNAMMRGDGDIVAGWKNKIQTSLATVTPSAMLAEQHRKLAEPLHDRYGRSAERDDSQMGLWSVLVPAGLAVAAGIALMNANNPKEGQRRTTTHDWGARRARGFNSGDYVSPSRSPSYPDGDTGASMERSYDVAQRKEIAAGI